MRSLLLFFTLCILTNSTLNATHLAGGNIQYRCLGFGQYEIIVTNYRDCSGISMPGNITIAYESASCGSTGTVQLGLFNIQEIVCPLYAGQTTCSGGPFLGIEKYSYVGYVTMPYNCPDWVFYQNVCCWDNSNVNIPGNTFSFHTQSTLDDANYVCNSNVVFGAEGLSYANLGQPMVFDPMGTDADGDELRYRLTDILQGLNTPGFYNGGFSGLNPINTITNLDSLSGRLEFTPNALGNYVIAYDVEEYRNGDLIAVTHMVIKIVVVNGGVSAFPTGGISTVSGGSSVGDSIMVCVNTPLSFDYTVTDPDVGDSIAILHNLAAELPGATFSSTGANPLVFNIQWTPTQAGIYNFGLIIENTGCPAPFSSQVEDLTIFVMDDNNQMTVEDYYLCSTDTITLSAPSGYVSYLWSTGETSQQIDVTAAGNYTVTTTGGNCANPVISVDIYDNPPFNLGLDQTILQGDSVQLIASLANNMVPGSYIDTFTNLNIGLASVVTLPLSVQNIFPATIDSTVLEYIQLDIQSPPSTSELEVYLVAPNTSMIPIALRKGGTTNPGYSNSQFGPNFSDPIANYNLTSSIIPADSSFLPEGDWYHFNGSQVNGEWQLAIRNLSFSNTAVLNYFGMQFAGGFDYQWTPDYALSCTDCPNPWAAPDSTTTYVFEASNAFGCVSYDSITITVIPRWTVDTLTFDLIENTQQSFCVNLEPNFGTAAADSTSAPSFGSISNSSFGCFDYTAGPNPGNSDAFWVYTCNSNGYCDSSLVIMNILPAWTNDTIQIDVFADSSLSFCVNLEPNFGTAATDSILTNGQYGNLTEASGFGCFDYQANSNIGVSDSVWVEVCNSQGLCDSTLIIINILPDWSTDTLEFIIAEDSLLSFCIPLESNFGTLSSDSIYNGPVNGVLNTGLGTACYDYQAGSNSELTDSIWIQLCNNIGFCDSVLVIVHTVSCVWAGDTDDDNIVSNYDVLPIGLGYGEIGDPRPNAGIDYDCEPHLNWNSATPVSNVDYKHADTDGNGIVEMDDTVAVVQNWGLLHLRNLHASAGNSASGAPFLVNYGSSFAGETIELPILLGDSLNPVDSAYGLAFTIYYDQSMVDTNSVFVNFDSSWLGTQNIDMIALAKDYYDYGQVQIGMSRIDHQPISGYGKIGSIQLTIKDDIIRQPNLHLIMGIGQTKLIDESENEVFIEGQPSYVLILPRATANVELETGQIRCFPNPTADFINLQSNAEAIQQVQLFNVAGQRLMHQEVNNLNSSIDLSNYSSGVYWISVQTTSGQTTRFSIVKK